MRGERENPTRCGNALAADGPAGGARSERHSRQWWRKALWKLQSLAPRSPDNDEVEDVPRVFQVGSFGELPHTKKRGRPGGRAECEAGGRTTSQGATPAPCETIHPHLTTPHLAKPHHTSPHPSPTTYQEPEREYLDEHLDDEVGVEHVVKPAQELRQPAVRVYARMCV